MSRQSQFLTAIDCTEAHRLFQKEIDLHPLGIESVPVSQSLGRIVACPVVARHNVPGFDRSNFDGFALQSADTLGASELKPATLELLPEKIPAGSQPTTTIKPGQTVSISTGGMLPRGANAVCLVENTHELQQEGKSQILVNHSVYPGSGISFAGTDIAQGETVMRRGQVITSRESGVLAAIGETEVQVFRKPKVAVISTGDEIIPPGETIKPGQVFDSNARIIADAVHEIGGEPLEMGIAIDDESILQEQVDRALQTADIVLLSGGTSKGEGDLSYRVVSRFQNPGIVAHGVALKPGKPICLAVTQRKPLVVLPGFPTSAIFTFHEFIAPVIRQLGGQAALPNTSVVTASLASRVNSEVGRTEFLLVGLLKSSEEADGSRPNNQTPSHLKAYPMGKGSGSVTTFSHADGFITIDRHTEILDEGQTVDVQLIGKQTRTADLVVMGSHCLTLDRILNELQAEGMEIRFFALGSSGGLNAAKRGDCDVAGIHLFDEQTGTYNEPFANSDIVIQKGYPRTQGLVCRANDPWVSRLNGLSVPEKLEAMVSDPSLMMINRNQGSGTRGLIDRLLSVTSVSKPPGYEVQASNHHAVCAAVVQGRADWGVAIQPVAIDHNLVFFPLEDEQFDFAIPKSRLKSDPVQRFLRKLEATSKSIG